MRQPIIALDARCIGDRKTGDTTYWTGLVHGLSQLESDLSIFLLSNASRPREIPESPRLRWIPLTAPGNRLWSLVAFPLAARRHGASAIHTQYNLSPLAKNGITTIHDVSFFVGPEWFRPRDRSLLQRFVPASARRARKVITVSETSKADILRYISGLDSKVSVTPLATNPRIAPVDRSVATRKVAEELNVSGPYMLTVGTRWPRKNMSLAVAAADLLPPKFPHKLVITGQLGWGEDEGGDRSKRVGYVSDEQLSCLYSAADLYLAPSRYEGFGLPLLEAFSCGCPVVCSEGGSLPEVAGNAAEVIRSWVAQPWSDAIASILGDSSKLSRMRELGFERANQFSWRETARLTEQVYREVIR